MRRRWPAALLLFVAALLPASAQAAFPGRNGQISVDGQVVNPDGTGLRPLVNGTHVRWSADGMRIVFTPTGGGIAIARADGNDVRIISANSTDRDPTWSPRGDRIAFAREVPGSPFGSLQIFTVALDGSDLQQLTHTEFTAFNDAPDWSPDGATIAYTQGYLGSVCGTLLGVRPDGAPAPLPVSTSPAVRPFHPDWAPDGSGLAWTASNACARMVGASLIGPDRRTLVRYDQDDCGFPGPTCRWYTNQRPAVAPDGSAIAYEQSSTGGPGSTVRIIGTDGTGDRPVIAASGSLDWRPLQQSPPPGGCVLPGAIKPGGHHDNVLIGTAGDDVICGGRGDDVLIGRGGDDVLIGGRGRDIILAGDGLDRVYGGPGRDLLSGAAGEDVLAGGAGRDLIDGDDGADSLIADDDAGVPDTIPCDPGPDPDLDLVLADASDRRSGCNRPDGADGD